jgi:hypothetical protein
MTTGVMERGRVVSHDGTPIAYELAGSGPSLVLVGGGLDDGAEIAPAAAMAAGVPSARRPVLAGQSHVPAPEAVAELLGFCTGARGPVQARGGQEAT